MAPAQLGPVLRQLRRLAGARGTDDLTDAQLLERFAARREGDAFAELVRRHGPLVWGVCRRVLRHEQDAEDAFQATFLALARHAAAVRRGEAVGGWLYRVAHRVATKAGTDMARRRTHERQARAPAGKRPDAELALRELQAVLADEVARLPEKYRAPFVLCCLEGRSGAEAARQLGLKEGTVTGRLTRTRQRLRERLARRGVALAAVLGLTDLARAAVPAALAAHTARAAPRFAAGAGSVSAEVAALVEGVSKAMFLTRTKIATAALLAAAALAAGAGLLAQREARAQPPDLLQPEPPRPRAVARKDADRPKPEAASDEAGDRVTVGGRVLGPDGKPFAGAELTVAWNWLAAGGKPVKPKAYARSDADGRFRFTFAKADVEDPSLFPGLSGYHFADFTVIAAAKGYGPGWQRTGGRDRNDLTLRLVPDDVPVKGRVLDLQGRPVAGAAVRVRHLTHREEGSLCCGAWAGLPANVMTDKDGRFTLTGVGRDRVAALSLDGPTIEHKALEVSTRTAEAATVEVVAGPCKPVEGTVRAKDTGKPLAGVLVAGGEQGGLYTGIHTVTDERGRYRLLGLAKAGQYAVAVYPKDGQSYLTGRATVGDSEGLKPVALDFDLTRGVAVRARLIDKATGKPVRGAAHYTPLGENPLFAERRAGIFGPSHYPDKDYVFRFVVPPGPGAVVGRGHGVPYLRKPLDPADEKAYPAVGKTPFMDGGLQGYAELFHTYRVFDARDTDKPLTLDLEIDPGRALDGRLVGPDGKPVAGAVAWGLTHDPVNVNNWSYRHDAAYRARLESQALEADRFTVLGLEPKGSRAVSFVHQERKLIGHAVVKGDDQGPLTVQLEPWGAVAGRLVGGDGQPLAGVRMRLHGPGMMEPEEVGTDREGRFRVEGLVPGLKHELTLAGTDEKVTLSAGAALQGLAVAAGAVKDVGDVRVTADPAK